MNISIPKAHRVLFLIVVFTILHFLISYSLSYYIASQSAAKFGNIVAEGLSESYSNPNSSYETAINICNDMKKKSDRIFSRWKIPLFILSLPIGPLINPFWNNIRKNWIHFPALSKKISKNQFIIRGKLIDYLSTGLNSIAFGLLIYFGFTLFQNFKMKSKHNV